MNMTSNLTIHQKLRKSAGWGIAVGVLLVILGVAAISLPLVAAIATSLMFGWLFLFAGIAQIVYAIQCRHDQKHLFWKLLLGIFYILGGILVLAAPAIAALTLTLIIGISIFVQSVIQVVGALQMRSDTGWGWLLFSGITGIILGILVWSEWPSSAVWFLGIWFGVNLLSDGMGLLMSCSMLRSKLPNQ